MKNPDFQGLALFISVLGAIFSTTAFLWNKLDKIWRAIADLRTQSVTHEVCSARRKRCRRSSRSRW